MDADLGANSIVKVKYTMQMVRCFLLNAWNIVLLRIASFLELSNKQPISRVLMHHASHARVLSYVRNIQLRTPLIGS